MNKLLDQEMLEIEDLQRTVDEDINTAKERFKVKDIEGANWCFRKLRVLSQQEQEITDLAAKEIERIKTWIEHETKKLDNSRNFFEALLHEYFVDLKEKDTKTKSVNTPYGKISTRKQAAKFVYNEEKLLEWVKANKPELIREKPEVMKDELKKLVKTLGSMAIDDNGEAIEGITVQEPSEKIIITVTEEE